MRPMRNVLRGVVVSLMAVLLFSSYGRSQNRQATQTQPTASDAYNRLAATGPGGPAPKKDLTGFWGGPAAQKTNPVPPMTPLGQQVFKTHKNESEYVVAESNDPIKSCDPLGFPRNMVFQTRGLVVAQMPDRMLVMSMYNKAWREIWTDGRALPTNVGANSPDAPDPRFYGYSVGHWEDDYTFVVDSLGTDDRTWLDQTGHPHSADMHVQERFKRVDHNTLEDEITINDPKMYTKPFVLSTARWRWLPEQDFEEEICVPSVMQDYLSLIANPAANGPGK